MAQSSGVQLLLTYGLFLQKRDNSRATSNKMMYKTTDSQQLILKKGRQVSASLKVSGSLKQ